jgi:hypothetical protein
MKEKTDIITRVCSWCQKVLGTVPAGMELDKSRSVSHGICETCRDTQLNEFKLELNK